MFLLWLSNFELGVFSLVYFIFLNFLPVHWSSTSETVESINVKLFPFLFQILYSLISCIFKPSWILCIIQDEVSFLCMWASSFPLLLLRKLIFAHRAFLASLLKIRSPHLHVVTSEVSISLSISVFFTLCQNHTATSGRKVLNAAALVCLLWRS